MRRENTRRGVVCPQNTLKSSIIQVMCTAGLRFGCPKLVKFTLQKLCTLSPPKTPRIACKSALLIKVKISCTSCEQFLHFRKVDIRTSPVYYTQVTRVVPRLDSLIYLTGPYIYRFLRDSESATTLTNRQSHWQLYTAQNTPMGVFVLSGQSIVIQ